MKTIITILTAIFILTTTSSVIADSYASWGHGNPVTGNNVTLTISHNTQFGDSGTSGQVLKFGANRTTLIIEKGNNLVIYGGIEVTGNNVDIIVKDGAVFEVHEDVVFDSKGNGTTPELQVDGHAYIAGSIKGKGDITGTGSMDVDGTISDGVKINPGQDDSVNVTGSETHYCAPKNLLGKSLYDAESNTYSVELSWEFGSDCDAPAYFQIKRDGVNIDKVYFGSKNSTFAYTDENEDFDEHSEPTYEVTASYSSGVNSEAAEFSFEDNPLPIELLSFSVKNNGNSVMIQWATAAEINNDYFTIERSTDGFSWEILDYMYGAGNSNQVLHYQYEDNQPVQGVSYYRLKQTDFDGQYEYFAPAAIQMDAKSAPIEILQVRASGSQMDIHISSFTGNAVLVVADIQGRIIHQQTLVGEDAFQQHSVSMQQNHAGNIVLIRLIGEETSIEQKIRVI